MMHNDAYGLALAAYQANPSQSQTEVAKAYGISQATLHRLIKRAGAVVNKVRYPGCHDRYREEILERWRGGQRVRTLAKEYGIHHQTIQRWIDELPIAQPLPQPPVVLTVFEPIQPWEDSGEVIHMGDLGRVLAEQFGQAWEGDE